MSPRRLALSIGLLALLSPLRSLAAPPASRDQRQSSVFGTEIALVSLPVFVVDRQGRAMRGLVPEDFELYDDGKPVPVISFQYVDTTSQEAQAEIREAPAARRRFLLLFDMSFTDVGGLHRARRAATDFIRHRLAESDLAAVATFDVNRGIRIAANFTEDRALLAHAVETLGVPALTRISDPLGLAANLSATDIERSTAERAGQATQLLTDSVLAVLARSLRVAEDSFYRRQVMSLIGSLDELGKGLRGVEGRKQILFFSAGFDAKVVASDLIPPRL